jgi:hypothetical protein
MSLDKQFSRKLDLLWNRRTSELRSLVIPRGVGKPSLFTKRNREKLISDLLETATAILLRRDGKLEFKKIFVARNLKQLKGRGFVARGENLISWAERVLAGPIVYCFWKGKKCLYVGKGKSWKRLKDYAKSAYLINANAIEVFLVHNASQLAKAECLATHLFEPRDRKVKPARVKWGKACPVCRKHDYIRDELKLLFRMR